MPRAHRRAKSLRSELTGEQWSELTDGVDSPSWEGGTAFETPIAKRAAWIANRDDILAARAEDPDAHRSRPSCWWIFDSPKQPRRVVGRRAPDPTVVVSDIRYRGTPIVESDIAYLIRYGLATPTEIAYLAELREENDARPEDVCDHTDALGATTMRKIDWEAYERAATDAA